VPRGEDLANRNPEHPCHGSESGPLVKGDSDSLTLISIAIWLVLDLEINVIFVAQKAYKLVRIDWTQGRRCLKRLVLQHERRSSRRINNLSGWSPPVRNRGAGCYWHSLLNKTACDAPNVISTGLYKLITLFGPLSCQLLPLSCLAHSRACFALQGNDLRL
jgi:hypothetical protein